MIPYIEILNSILFFVSLFLVFKKANSTHNDFYLPFFTFLIGLILYHLTNPIPYDLQMYERYYLDAARDPYSIKSLVIRDPLGYGSMLILAQIFPNVPETYYFLNMIIWSGSLWLIFREIIKRLNLTSLGKVIIFFFLFFLWFDLNDVHYSMRHSIGCALVAMSFLFFNTNKVLSIGSFVFAILWQGTLIVLLPIFLLMRTELSLRRNLKISAVLLALGFAVSYINIYELIPTKALLDLNVNQFFPRFHAFFLSSTKSSLYELSKQNGHDPFWMLELPFYLLCLALLTRQRFYNGKLLLILNVSFFFVIACRFHFAMILRFESLFELCGRAVLLWALIVLLVKDDAEFIIKTDHAKI